MRHRLLAGLLVASIGAVAPVVSPSPAGAVVGGREADEGEWPWQVALLIDGTISCGGSLVAPDLVLTAAHCTEDVDEADFEVVAGTIDLRSGGQRRRVEAIDQHEGYDAAELENDLSLLELDRPFALGDDLALVSLASREESALAGEDGHPAVVTGFGERSARGDTSDLLLEGEIDTVGDERCEALYREDGDTVFGDSQVCAGRTRGHVDACFGDSGGPLVVPIDDGWRQVGIVSWGSGCGVPDRPTVYTEVAAFADWLAERGVGPEDSLLVSGEGARVPARGTSGKASRYPLTIEVEEFDGDLSSISVELLGLRHERPSDLDVRLVAPDGTTVTVLSDVGGSNALEDADVLVVEGVAPAGGQRLRSPIGPSDREADEQWRGGRAEAELGLLEGIDPVGTWQLLVADDRTGFAGSLEGWDLQLR
jgi:trypsin